MNAYFIFLIRKNQVAHLAAHLVAGLIAITVLSGMASGKTKPAPAAPHVLGQALPAVPAGTLASTTPAQRR